MTSWEALFIAVPVVAALAASLGLTPLAGRLARHVGAVDHPDHVRKLHAGPTPRLGGVAVCLALLAGMLVAVWLTPRDPRLASLAVRLSVTCGLVCMCGALDDVWQLSARRKLLLQVVSVLPVVLGGHLVSRVVIFGFPIELGPLGPVLTVLWLVGCINAVNLLDGMDGLAATVGLSSAAMVALVALSGAHPHVSQVALVLAGALLGFLVFNLPPAKIFLGDSGSMVIGLAIGLLGIEGALKTPTTLSLTAPAVVLSLPMWDAVLAVVRRRLTGQPIHLPDRGHIHHRLLERGFSTWQALCVVAAVCLTTGAAATAATVLRNDALAWVTSVSLFVLLIRMKACGHHELALASRAWQGWWLRSRTSRAVAGSFDAPRSRLRQLEIDLAALGATRFELAVSRSDGYQARCRLACRGALNRGPQWTTTMRFVPANGSRWSFGVSGPARQLSDLRRQETLTELLRGYFEHADELLSDVPAEQWEIAAEATQPAWASRSSVAHAA